eukprot:TRINITY_DN12483_c0_g1_i1.p1 TRINITY_DN12483_c0_g1~~TRINITY_DN12483_c0_g1_i1.p1  ORF type:complete len:248 (+),score=53.94 TRINITY_DN12483_c0_g1_i1:70-813(+)
MGCVSSKPNASTPTAAPSSTNEPTKDVVADAEVTSEETREPSDNGNEMQADVDLQAVMEIFRNVLVGLVGEALPSVMPALQTTGRVLQDFRNVVEAFDAQDGLRGLQLLGESLQVLPSVLTAAGSTKEQIEGLASVLSLFVAPDPARILFHAGRGLLVDGRDYLQRITRACSAFKKSNWQAFGLEIGGIIGDVLSPVETRDDGSDGDHLEVVAADTKLPEILAATKEEVPGSSVPWPFAACCKPSTA